MMIRSAAIVLLCLLAYARQCLGIGMLYPRDSESRETKFLDGLWHFRADTSSNRQKGFEEQWWKNPLSKTGPVIDMPVPASYNDVTEDKALRDFVGWAWYDRTFFIPSEWSKKRIVLRFDSAHYYTMVWLNGKALMEHNGGHLPFEADITSYVNFSKTNLVTVAVNNTLTPTTLPPGEIHYQSDSSKYPPGYFVQDLQMDFFNYAGIHRHVRLYTTPKTYIDDITVLTDVVGNKAQVKFMVSAVGTVSSVNIEALDAQGHKVASCQNLSNILTVDNPELWWPYGMNNSVGYRYTLKVEVNGDIYRLPFGIRTLQVTESQFLINSKPFYCHGVDRHEDSDLRGKGLDYTLFTKDFNMLRWLGVNCFRTSHYPYAEEILDLADRQGIAIIDESPGVGITKSTNFGNTSLQHHIEVMDEMIRRDKNKPCVIMWSVANEPASDLSVAKPYFEAVIKHTKQADPAHRPVTFVSSKTFETDVSITFVDVICFNRYYAWYSDPGHLEVIQLQLARELEGFRKLYKKPMIVSEYGADTVTGLHREPSFMFTEEFQVDFMKEYHKGFDKFRSQYLVGELVWNYADFMTIQGVTRVVGNKKGLLTRQRQPKPAAFVIRDRYNAILQGLNTSHLYSNRQNLHSSPHQYLGKVEL